MAAYALKSSISVLLLYLLLTNCSADPNMDCPEHNQCLRIPHDCASDELEECNCEAIVMVEKFADKGTLLFRLLRRGSGFLAVGVSKDRFMGNDIVAACTDDGVHTVWTVDTPQKTAVAAPGLLDHIQGVVWEDPFINVTNGFLTCSFSVTPPLFFDNGMNFTFGDPYFLLASKGTVSPAFPFVTYHSRDRSVDEFDLWNATEISPAMTPVTCAMNDSTGLRPNSSGTTTFPGDLGNGNSTGGSEKLPVLDQFVGKFWPVFVCALVGFMW